MKLDVRLFAAAREIAGVDRVELDVPDSARVADLRSALAERFPEMRSFISSLLIGVGTDYADDRTPLDGKAEIACFPPVSGG